MYIKQAMGGWVNDVIAGTKPASSTAWVAGITGTPAAPKPPAVATGILGSHTTLIVLVGVAAVVGGYFLLRKKES